MAFHKPHSTLCEMSLTKTSDKVDLVETKPYHEIISSLKYVMVATRPDICYTVTRLSQDLTKTKFFPFNEGQACLTLFKRYNQSFTNT